MTESSRDKLVKAMYKHEKSIGRMELIILSQNFFEKLKEESMFPKSFNKCNKLYEIPYILNGRKVGFTIK